MLQFVCHTFICTCKRDSKWMKTWLFGRQKWFELDIKAKPAKHVWNYSSTFVFVFDNTVTNKLFISQQWVSCSHEKTRKSDEWRQPQGLFSNADDFSWILPLFYASSSPTVRTRARPLLTCQLRCHAHLPWPPFEGHDSKQRQHGVTNIVKIEIVSLPFSLFLL